LSILTKLSVIVHL